MQILRVVINSVVLAIVNLGAILVGFAFYYFFPGQASQLPIQVTAAVVITLLGFTLWSGTVGWIWRDYVRLTGRNELIATYVAAFAWVLILFYPLHYLTQGYIASFGNIIALWKFQLLANALTLFISHKATASSSTLYQVVEQEFDIPDTIEPSEELEDRYQSHRDHRDNMSNRY